MRQGNKELRTKGKTESWMSLQNSPGSRKILDKRKTNTMNLSERLPWVCWTQFCLGTNPSDSPSRTLVGQQPLCPCSLGLCSGDLLTLWGTAKLPVPRIICSWSCQAF